MITVYRIVKSEYNANAFDGEGARRYGGRWNEIGTAMVYTSESLSLASLELFVQLDLIPSNKMNFVSIKASLPQALIKTANDLPPNWMMNPIPLESQAFGSLWLNEKTSAVLKVPSILIPSEFNYLINPNHPDFRQIKIDSPIPFSFDFRMWKEPSRH